MIMKKTLICLLLLTTGGIYMSYAQKTDAAEFKKEITATLRTNIITEADWAMQQQPITVAAHTDPKWLARSVGSKPGAKRRQLLIDRDLLHPEFAQQRKQIGGFGCDGHGVPLRRPARQFYGDRSRRGALCPKAVMRLPAS